MNVRAALVVVMQILLPLSVQARDCITSTGESFQTNHPCWRIAEGARERGADGQEAPNTSPPAAPVYSAPAQSFAPASSGGSSGYIRGPKGGCYTYSSSGKKRYVDRSMCN